jgi:hypothetical protein
MIMTPSLSLLSSLLLFAFPILAEPSLGCSSNTPKPLEWSPVPGEVKIFRVNDRHVRVTVPSTYNETKPAPMILAFHDKDQPVEHLEFDGGWDEPSINPDIIMVYPVASEENVFGPSVY